MSNGATNFLGQLQEWMDVARDLAPDLQEGIASKLHRTCDSLRQQLVESLGARLTPTPFGKPNVTEAPLGVLLITGDEKERRRHLASLLESIPGFTQSQDVYAQGEWGGLNHALYSLEDASHGHWSYPFRKAGVLLRVQKAGDSYYVQSEPLEDAAMRPAAAESVANLTLPPGSLIPRSITVMVPFRTAKNDSRLIINIDDIVATLRTIPVLQRLDAKNICALTKGSVELHYDSNLQLRCSLEVRTIRKTNWMQTGSYAVSPTLRLDSPACKPSILFAIEGPESVGWYGSAWGDRHRSVLLPFPSNEAVQKARDLATSLREAFSAH